MVVALGSMAIKGVFKAGSLLSGLGSTSNKLKEVKQRGKSTTTEMKRMTGQTHLLSKAMAAIGVAGFSALLMTTPQLAGSLAMIKLEMTKLAWSIGKHLKPALDAVATILRGIRTGSWETVNKGAEDLYNWLVDILGLGVDIILEPVIGEEATAQLKTDFNNWLAEMEAIAKEKNLWAAIWHGAVTGVKWFIENLDMLNAWCDTFNTKFGEWSDTLTNFVTPEWMKEIARDIEKFDDWVGRVQYEPLGIDLHKWSGGILGRPTKTAEDYGGYEYQTGGLVPRTGMYKLHAGETVTMQGSTPGGAAGGPTEINIDFTGAIINLASGIELNEFAEVISNKIAERQHSLTY